MANAGGAECAISEGDALQLAGLPPANATAADLVVLSSKGGRECRSGSRVSVAIADLQEMENHMRETIDKGLGELQSKQKGLPPIPQAGTGGPERAPFAADPSALGPESNAGTQINEQEQAADQAERQVLSQPSSDAGSRTLANAQTTTPVRAASGVISIGQSMDEVMAILGSPLQIFDKGATLIHVYTGGEKVTYNGGKVADIQ